MIRQTEGPHVIGWGSGMYWSGEQRGKDLGTEGGTHDPARVG